MLRILALSFCLVFCVLIRRVRKVRIPVPPSTHWPSLVTQSRLSEEIYEGVGTLQGLTEYRWKLYATYSKKLGTG